MTDDRAALDDRPAKGAPPERAGRRVRPTTLVRHRMFPWALFLLALAAAVTFAVLWLGARGGDEREAAVLDTSRRFLGALTNFSSETIEEDVGRLRSFAVGQFAEEVEQTFSDERLEAIRENRAVSTGRVESVFIQSLEGNAASVFGVVEETIVNRSLPAPRQDILRVELELIETPDGWKVNSVQILQSPGVGPFG